ncbi:MAG: PilN domain-containing protein [Magnetococcales bacterium]|nr:PilN domain-containing protein [Magnetococcales bacterium]
MILRINLLPYREARRLQKVQAIAVAWGLTALVGLIAIFIAKGMIADHLSAQQITQKRNKEIIARLDEKLGEIKDINSRKKEVKARLEIIDTLSRQRNLPVFLLEAISLAIPDKVWLKEISTIEQTLTVIGYTLSNAMVADFMRRLDSSPHLAQVNLKNIAQSKGKENLDRKLREFHISAHIVMPSSPEDKEGRSQTVRGR